MELLPWLIAAAMVITFVLAARGLARGDRDRRAAIDQVARDLRLRFEPGRRHEPPCAKGLLGGHSVWVESSVGSQMSSSTRIAITSRLPAGLSVKKRERHIPPDQSVPSGGVQTGEPGFDRSFVVVGARPVEVLARLGHRSRAAIREAIEDRGIRVQGGELGWSRDWAGESPAPSALVAKAEELRELADALTEHAGRPARALLHHAFEDPHVGCRRRTLEALLTELGDSPEATEALERAEGDSDCVIRYLAARQRGEEGLEVIRRLVLSHELPPAQRREGAAMLAGRLGGGLSLSHEEAGGGELSFEPRGAGGLSPVDRSEDDPT